MNKIKQDTFRRAPQLLMAVMTMLIVIASCKKTEYIDPQELLDAENELLVRFYNEKVNRDEDGNLLNDSTRLEVYTAAAIDTVDHRFESGMMLFHTEMGRGDVISANRMVGYRYVPYMVVENDTLAVQTYLDGPGAGNIYKNSPDIFLTQPLVYSTGQLQQVLGGTPVGINEAVQHMRLGGKARVVMPSPVFGLGGYDTYVYDIEITYIDQQ